MLRQGRWGRWLLLPDINPISYQCRLQVEGANMIGGAGVWRGQRMQEDSDWWDGHAAGLLFAHFLDVVVR